MSFLDNVRSQDMAQVWQVFRALCTVSYMLFAGISMVCYCSLQKLDQRRNVINAGLNLHGAGYVVVYVEDFFYYVITSALVLYDRNPSISGWCCTKDH